jgi:ribonuclease Z
MSGTVLKDVPVIIVECTFLEAELHAERAAKTKHTLWRDLEPVVRAQPDTIFVLIHFSLTYKEQYIRNFFQKLALPNVLVWV